MQLKYILLLGVILIVTLAITGYSGPNFDNVTCEYFYAPFLGYSGYTCDEHNGIIRTFMNPGAYETMSNYYMPPAEETFIPESTYIYVMGSGTETFS